MNEYTDLDSFLKIIDDDCKNRDYLYSKFKNFSIKSELSYISYNVVGTILVKEYSNNTSQEVYKKIITDISKYKYINNILKRIKLEYFKENLNSVIGYSEYLLNNFIYNNNYQISFVYDAILNYINEDVNMIDMIMENYNSLDALLDFLYKSTSEKSNRNSLFEVSELFYRSLVKDCMFACLFKFGLSIDEFIKRSYDYDRSNGVSYYPLNRFHYLLVMDNSFSRFPSLNKYREKLYEYFYTNIIKYFDEKDYKSHHMEFITYDRYIDMVFTYILPRMNYIQRHNFFKYTYTDKEQIKKALKLKSDVMKEDIKKLLINTILIDES